MRKILVATDFSSNSQSGIRFALSLARVFNARVELYNSFVTVPAIGIDGGANIINESVIAAGIATNQKKLNALIAGLSEEEKKDLIVTGHVDNGDPVASICDYVQKHGHDLIIMGTRGESRFEEMLFGSTTVDVMKQANCPVLAIPPGVVYSDIRKIVYATDLEEKDIDVIQHLCDMASEFDAEVVVFHAFLEDTMDYQEEADEFNDLLHKKVFYPKLKKESITYGNSHDAILEVIKKDAADLIVMREKKRGIFGRLFHPDMVKRINFHTTIPLLTYNDNSL